MGREYSNRVIRKLAFNDSSKVAMEQMYIADNPAYDSWDDSVKTTLIKHASIAKHIFKEWYKDYFGILR